MAWKAEVLVQGSWSQNSEVWPDKESAQSAGLDLFGRWFLVEDSRAVEVDEEVNRPTWIEWCARGMKPPKSVTL